MEEDLTRGVDLQAVVHGFGELQRLDGISPPMWQVVGSSHFMKRVRRLDGPPTRRRRQGSDGAESSWTWRPSTARLLGMLVT
jgi:hypothetical protein